jgi:hypothetical protein
MPSTMTEHPPITVQEVEAAQAAWGAGIVQIGAADTWQAAHARATQLVQDLYIGDGSLLFCPTKASTDQFRRTQAGAVSYLVGQDTARPEDCGFALEPWTAVRFETIDTLIRGDMAITMGNYFFDRADGSALRAEFSLVYTRRPTGALRIQLHHSAMPFTG